MIGERDQLQQLLVAAPVERRPPAVRVLHGEQPTQRAFPGAVDPASVLGVDDLQTGERGQHHGRVVAVRIELVRVLEVPAADLAVAVLPLPVPRVAHLLAEQPLRRALQGLVVGLEAGRRQNPSGLRRVPDGRKGGLDLEGISQIHFQLFERGQLATNGRILRRVAEAAKGEDGVDDRRKDRTQTIAHVEASARPLFRSAQRFAAQGLQAAALQQLDPFVRPVEEVVPAARPRPSGGRRGFSRLGDVQLGNTRMLRDRALRLVGPDNRKRNEDAARPGGHLVQVEVEPSGQEHHLRRDRRAALPVVLAEDGQVYLGVRVGRLDPAELQDHPSGLRHVSIVGIISEQLQDEVGLDGRAHLRRATVVDGPPALRQLQPPDATSHLPDPLLVRSAQKMQ